MNSSTLLDGSEITPVPYYQQASYASKFLTPIAVGIMSGAATDEYHDPDGSVHDIITSDGVDQFVRSIQREQNLPNDVKVEIMSRVRVLLAKIEGVVIEKPEPSVTHPISDQQQTVPLDEAPRLDQAPAHSQPSTASVIHVQRVRTQREEDIPYTATGMLMGTKRIGQPARKALFQYIDQKNVWESRTKLRVLLHNLGREVPPELEQLLISELVAAS